MENQPVDELKKRWFIEGLVHLLEKKMKVVPLPSYIDAKNRAVDIENENKTSQEKNKSSDNESMKDSNSDHESKIVQALRLRYVAHDEGIDGREKEPQGKQRNMVHRL